MRILKAADPIILMMIRILTSLGSSSAKYPRLVCEIIGISTSRKKVEKRKFSTILCAFKRAIKVCNFLSQIVSNPWYLYKMVTQIYVRTAQL